MKTDYLYLGFYIHKDSEGFYYINKGNVVRVSNKAVMEVNR